MWHALRAELAYSRPYLLGGLGLAVGIAVLITVIFAVVSEGPPRQTAAGIRPMFLVLAPLIVGIIVQATRTEERRVRLLLAGPLTPWQIAGSTVLLPVVMLAISGLAAGLVIGVEYLITGTLARGSLYIVGFVGGQLFAYAQLGLLAQEATAARGQGRPRVGLAGWAGFAVLVVVLAVLYLALARELLTWAHLILGHLIVAGAAGAASMALFARRTDFTR